MSTLLVYGEQPVLAAIKLTTLTTQRHKKQQGARYQSKSLEKGMAAVMSIEKSFKNHFYCWHSMQVYREMIHLWP